MLGHSNTGLLVSTELTPFSNATASEGHEMAKLSDLFVDALIGKVYLLAERLASDREDATASEALFRLAKIRGWIAGESEHKPSLLDSLKQVDIDTLRAQIKKAEEQGQGFDLAKAIVELKAPKVN